MPQAADALNSVAPSTPAPKRTAPAKTTLWIVLGIVALFVFLTSEVPLLTNYVMYRDYRLHLIADRYLFVPHAVFATTAFLIGPFQFSMRLRQKHLQLHRIMGRIYVFAVFTAVFFALLISYGHPLFPGTIGQGGAWVLCTAFALITARNRHIAQHRQWMTRSYAVCFTFFTLRVPDLLPRYWGMSDNTNVYLILGETIAVLLIADIVNSWREITTQRA